VLHSWGTSPAKVTPFDGRMSKGPGPLSTRKPDPAKVTPFDGRMSKGPRPLSTRKPGPAKVTPFDGRRRKGFGRFRPEDQAWQTPRLLAGASKRPRPLSTTKTSIIAGHYRALRGPAPPFVPVQ
jgi:hypothetical protein